MATRLEQKRYTLNELRPVIRKIIRKNHHLSQTIRDALLNYRTPEQLIGMVLHQFGRGTIGLKALGLEAAHAILNHPRIRQKYGIEVPVKKPRSYYLGSNWLLEFLKLNEKKLGKYRRLKLETFEHIIAVQEELEHDFLVSPMPKGVMRAIEEIIDNIRRPIIARSSSKLEDNPEASFAGKYASYFWKWLSNGYGEVYLARMLLFTA